MDIFIADGLSLEIRCSFSYRNGDEAVSQIGYRLLEILGKIQVMNRLIYFIDGGRSYCGN